MEYKIKHLEYLSLGNLEFDMYSDGSLTMIAPPDYDEFSLSPQEVRDLIDFLVKNTNLREEE